MLHTTVSVGHSDGERRVWTDHEVVFSPKDHGAYAASYELGRACFRVFGTEYVHAEDKIRNERGTVLFSASPAVVAEGIHDEWINRQ